MMINKRLIGTVKESKKYIAGNVICQWVSLVANITMMGAIARLLQSLFAQSTGDGQIALTAVIAAAAVVIRFACNILSARILRQLEPEKKVQELDDLQHMVEALQQAMDAKFLLENGNRVKIKRKLFEEYLDKANVI